MKTLISKINPETIRLVVLVVVLVLFVISATAPLAVGGLGGN